MKASLQKQDSGRKKLSDTYNLKALFPQVAGEWDYDKNKEKPEDMYPYSGKRYTGHALLILNTNGRLLYQTGQNGCRAVLSAGNREKVPFLSRQSIII